MTDYTAIKQQLEKQLEELLKRVEQIDDTLSRPGDKDWEERALEMENDEVQSALGTMGMQEIRQIRRALHQIDNGTYGKCENCGAHIDVARLEALPFATRCATCA